MNVLHSTVHTNQSDKHFSTVVPSHPIAREPPERGLDSPLQHLLRNKYILACHRNSNFERVDCVWTTLVTFSDVGRSASLASSWAPVRPPCNVPPPILRPVQSTLPSPPLPNP